MAKQRQTSPQNPPSLRFSRGQRKIAVTAVLMTLFLVVGIFARYRYSNAPPNVAPQQSQNLGLSKEYIYAGGRLLATEQPAPTASCTPSPSVNVIISEFRFRGPQGANDEFIELYNASDSSVSVCASDGSTGWTIATRSADGAAVVLATVPNGTGIPARGHYLVVGSSYSLGTNANQAREGFIGPAPPGIDASRIVNDLNPGNPGGLNDLIQVVGVTGTTLVENVGGSAQGNLAIANSIVGSTTSVTRLTANGNGQYLTDTADNAGVALFSTSNPANFTPDRRLDAAGFSNMTGPNADLYREGSGLPPISGDGEYSFVRKIAGDYYPQDTNNNANDFWFISTSAGTFGGVVSILGAPSPENVASPRRTYIAWSWLDPSVHYTASPNWVRCQTCTGPNAQYGTLGLRHTFTNNTEQTITRLRFRTYIITTLNSPGYVPGGAQADVRLLSSNDTTWTRNDGSTVTVRGTLVETPPDQPNGGGQNTGLLLPLSDAGLRPGESISAQFVLGIQQSGYFRFYAVMEALP